MHADGAVSDHAFADIVELLPAAAIIGANDTRVIPARVLGHKDTGGAIELFFLEPAPEVAPGGWRCLAKGTLRPGMTVTVGDVRFPVLAPRAPDGSIVVGAPPDLLGFLDRHGHSPLPHYIARDDRPEDRERYQTMFARVPGAVAAPTAGLHMTPQIRDRLLARGIQLATLEVEVRSALDLAGFLAVRKDAPVAMTGIEYTIRVAGDGTPEQFEQLRQQAQAHSPNAMSLLQGVPLSGRLVVAQAA